MFDPVELEEDRRLCYVAVTRAREELYITRAKSRMLYGQTNRNPPSRFIGDIPTGLTEEIDRSHSYGDFGGDFGGGRYGGSRYGGQTSFGGYGGGGYSYSVSEQEVTPVRGSYSAAPRAAGTQVTVGKTPRATSVGACRFAVGDVVTHASFGTGKILEASAMAGDTLLVIDFDKAGRKKLMANYAKLEKV